MGIVRTNDSIAIGLWKECHADLSDGCDTRTDFTTWLYEKYHGFPVWTDLVLDEDGKWMVGVNFHDESDELFFIIKWI